MDFDGLYERLNDEQREAVEAIEGPVQVIAGPGTGKTQILAMRIANILKKTDMDPQNILALTFTESGVNAMRKRLKSIIGKPAYSVNIYTFHSFCSRVFSEFPEKFALKRELSLIDDIKKIEILREILDSFSFEHLISVNNRYFFLRSIMSAISDLKREGVFVGDLDDYVKKALKELAADQLDESTYGYIKRSKEIAKLQELALIYREYSERLKAASLYDFDDMILFVLEKFEEDSDLLLYYQELFQYILVDEYQDTNSAQNQLVRKIASYFESPNLFVVGDDDQSIFRFQGASLENVMLFNKWYPDAKSIVLKSNYRSAQLILDAASSVISNNSVRLADSKELVSALDVDDKPIELVEFNHGEFEIKWVVDKITSLRDQGIDLEQIAVIVRDNKDKFEIIEALAKASVPYHVYGGGNILDDNWVRKILAMMKVVVDPFDDFNLYQVMSLDCFEISQVDLYKLSYLASKSRKSFFKVVNDKKLAANLDDDALIRFSEFFELIFKLQRLQSNLDFESFFVALINETGFLKLVMSLPDRLEVINKVNSLHSFIVKQKVDSISSLLSNIDSMREHRLSVPEIEWETTKNAVQVMTAHKAKGLEFEYVFMPMVYDGKWGNKRAPSMLKLPADLLEITEVGAGEANEDERRLFYVGLTRAKREVFLSFSNSYSGESSSDRIVSQFVDEIGEKYIEKVEVTDGNLVDLTEFKYSEPSASYFGEIEKEYIESILRYNFKMSPTALNTYLECKRRFFYENIVKLPFEKTPALILGSAVHEALERLFIEIKNSGQTPSLNFVNSVFEKSVLKENATERDREAILAKGSKILEDWYNQYKDSFKSPLFVELYFGNKNIVLDDVPLTGKVDKIEMIGDGRAKLIDYKTGRVKSRNDILGATKSSDGSVIRQLYFYKILCDLDPTIKVKIDKGEIDFIAANERGNFKKEEFDFEDEKLEEVKKLIVDSYGQMLELDFGKPGDFCDSPHCICKEVFDW